MSVADKANTKEDQTLAGPVFYVKESSAPAPLYVVGGGLTHHEGTYIALVKQHS